MFKNTYLYKLISLKYINLKKTSLNTLITVLTIYSRYFINNKNNSITTYFYINGIHRIKPQSISFFYLYFYQKQENIINTLFGLVQTVNEFVVVSFYSTPLRISSSTVCRSFSSLIRTLKKILFMFSLKLISTRYLTNFYIMDNKYYIYKTMWFFYASNWLRKAGLDRYHLFYSSVGVINSSYVLQNNLEEYLNVVSLLRYSKFFNKIKFSRNRQVVFSIVQFGLFTNILLILLCSSIYYQITPDLSYLNILVYLISATQVYFWVLFISGGVYIKLSSVVRPVVNVCRLLY